MQQGEDNIRHTLKKPEILRKKKSIQELFENGSSFFLHPFKIFYLPLRDAQNNQVMFSVSKKHFKQAIKRNKIKRRIREAYRLHKSQLTIDQHNIYYSIAIVYISKLVLPYQEIEKGILKGLRRLNNIEEK